MIRFAAIGSLQETNANMKIYPFLSILLLVSCDPGKNPTSTMESNSSDQALRGFLGVSSLAGSFEVPQGSNSYIVTTLEFEDGEFVRRGSMNSGGADTEKDVDVPAQLLWGTVDGTGRGALITPGSYGRSIDTFWVRLGATHSFEDSANVEYDGFQVLGLGQSNETRDGMEDRGFGPDIDLALREKKYVGLLVARTFKTKEERESFLDSSLPDKKRQNKSEQATPRKPSD